LIIGLPVPQIFLYEQEKNKFLVIDGQQRLMSIYYFLKKRFPRLEKRAELRKIFDEPGCIPEKILNDWNYFQDFNLRLSTNIGDRQNRLEDLNYDNLSASDRPTLGLRTLRCIVIKQYEPKDDSSMYEIFFRLNTGGVNLLPQEIRSCVYYSRFYEMLSEINLDPRWRRLTKAEPDIRMRDVESLLRGFAMLHSRSSYKSPMVRFLNTFSEKSKKLDGESVTYLKQLFTSFLNQCNDLPPRSFYSRIGRFSISMYEAIFSAVCEEAYSIKGLNVKPIMASKLDKLKDDPQFINASQSQTTSKENVALRYERARAILLAN
jgi:hypothetical protein